MRHGGGTAGLKAVRLESPSQKPSFWDSLFFFILLSKDSNVFLFLMDMVFIQQEREADDTLGVSSYLIMPLLGGWLF